MENVITYSGQLRNLQHEMVVKGREEAAAHRPPSDAVRPDKNESEIKTDAERYIANEVQLLASAITESSRAATSLQQHLIEIEGQIQQVLTDRSLNSTVHAEMASERSNLARATEQRVRAEVELKSFRARHGITTPAVYPESHVWHFGIILSLALVETIVNAFFYENAQGLLGGFVVALGVSVINMAGALVLGIAFQQKNLRDTSRRMTGFGALLLFLVLTVFCNALFAAFRSEYQVLSDPTDSAQVRGAFTNAIENATQIFLFRMNFGDLMSFILFGIGILLTAFAFYKGYTFDDPYPGHGPKDRILKAAKQEELDEQARMRDRIKTIFQNKVAIIQRLISEPSNLISQTSTKKASLQNSQISCVAAQESIQRDFELCLRAYREANTAIRGTTPPTYFKEIPDIQHIPEKAKTQQIFEKLGETESAARAMREREHPRLTELLNNVNKESAEALNTWLTSFLRDVEQQAEAEINRNIHTLHGKIQ